MALWVLAIHFYISCSYSASNIQGLRHPCCIHSLFFIDDSSSSECIASNDEVISENNLCRILERVAA